MKNYQTPKFDAATAKPFEAQLMQLMQVTSDGDLISKSTRDLLVEQEFATRFRGWNMITPEGVQYLQALDLIHG